MDISISLVPPHKQCTACKQFKVANLDNFTSDSSKKDGLATRCKDCRNSARRNLYVPHPYVAPIDPSIPDEQKKCNVCLVCKPKTLDFFAPEKHGKDGLRATCRECRNKRKRKAPKPPITERECFICGALKPIAEFTRNTQRTESGTSTEKACKDCRNTKTRQSRKDNPEPFRKQDRKRYAKRYQLWKERYRNDKLFRARINEIRRRFYQRHREEILLRRKRYTSLHPEIMRAGRQRNREKIREYKKIVYHRTPLELRREQGRKRRRRNADRIRILNANRAALKKGASGKFTIADIRMQYARQRGKCYYCNNRIKWGKHHVDHVVPLTRGGSNDPSNLVVACPTCNIKKHNKLLHEWPEGGHLI